MNYPNRQRSSLPCVYRECGRDCIAQPEWLLGNAVCVTVEMPCGDCSGRGYDLGSLFEPEECPTCHGAKTVPVERNYLKEALHIANGQSFQTPEREHLLSLIKYARALVNAVMVLPEVA